MYLIAGNNRDFHFNFVDINTPIPRPRFAFPSGTTFSYKARGKEFSIDKTPEYNENNRYLTVRFTPYDTRNINRDTQSRWELTANFPDEKHYTLCQGDLFISAPLGY